jgi:hypothetical protein
MNKRTILIFFSWILCAGTVFAVLSQRQALIALRAQIDQTPDRSLVLDRLATPSIAVGKEADNPAPLSEPDSHELLRLRSEVTRLTARKRELAAVSEEALQLRSQLARNQTNSSSGIPVPPGYIRKSLAQFVGYSTPENTVQSFLAALQNHDVANVLRAFSPDEASGMTSRLSSSPSAERDFFKGADSFPGMSIHHREDLPDGSVELQVDFIPGLPSEKLHLRNFNGEWKLLEGF